MALQHYGDLIKGDYVYGEKVNTREYNSRARILDAQTEGALEGIGAGVVEGGVVTAGGGLSVNVTPLRAVADTQHGMVFIATTDAGVVTGLPSTGTVYIWVRAVFRVAPEDPDSRESGYAELFWSVSDEGEADAVLLAKVVASGGAIVSVDDARTFVTATQALTLAEALWDGVEGIKNAVGDDYFGASPPAASLDDRVDALEAGGGGEGGPVYWKGLQKGLGDPTTIEQQIAADILEHVTGYHSQTGGGGAGIAAGEWDVDALNQALAALKVTRSVDPDHPVWFRECAVIVWGAYGEGSGGTPEYVDWDHSTWLPPGYPPA